MVTMNACKVKVMRVESRSDNRTVRKHGTITHSHTHPNQEIKRDADLWRLCFSWPNTDNRGASSPIKHCAR